MQLPIPRPLQFSSLMADIENGTIKIPQFQRDFVWDTKKSASLIDSIVKGYPIGTFIFWKTKEELRSVKNIGGIALPETEDGDYIEYVLDGQQRLTSLFASMKGVQIQRDKKIEDFSLMYLDLDADESEQVVIHFQELVDISNQRYIKLCDLLTGELTYLASFSKERQKKITYYKQRLEAYNYSTISVKEAPLDIATDIFTRINVGGKPLSLFEIMVAKTFDREKDFDLSEKFEEFTSTLESVNYETISSATGLQTVSLVLSGECTKKQILKLKKEDIIDVWPKIVDSIETSVDYFRTYYRIPVSKLLPYNALLAPFAYFFTKHKDRPTGEIQRLLQDFFWRCSLSERYSSAVESKLAQDVKKIDTILKAERPKYDWSVDISTDYIEENGWFSAGRSYIKALLCILTSKQPKSFVDGASVKVSNDWLKQANSRNYHHFFPRAYLRKRKEEEEDINHILNITIVDDFLNKKLIGAKAPSKYMTSFKEKNPELQKHMKTHLINDLDKFGIWEDDYDTFWDKRAAAFSSELKKRIIIDEVDKNLKLAEVKDKAAEEC